MTVRPERIKAALAARARELGCAALGVTTAAPLLDRARLKRWLAAGYAGDLEYLHRQPDRRADPASLLAGARSVVCVAVPHEPPLLGPATAPGRVAAFAGGRDYHQVVGRILQDLAECLTDATSGAEISLPAVDTQPVLERALARRAGLGAIGKHTQLIVPGHGAAVVLGELVTTAWLPPDEPFSRDLCEECTACLSACPTGALVAPYVLDARRCLSHQTTANHGAIPHWLRYRLENRLYGCDACQIACPHTPSESSVGHPELDGDPLWTMGRLHLSLQHGNRALKRSLRDTALGWLPPGSIKRNLCVALGNSGDQRHVGPLVHALRHGPALVRRHAAWALGRLGGPEAVLALENAQGRESDPAVQEELALALDSVASS